MEYPRFVYKKGDPFITEVAHDDESREKLLADGWKDSVPELDGQDERVEPAAQPAEVAASEHDPVIDDSLPTRAEIETKARELAIKFDGRTSDKKLLGLIDKALNSGLE